jgi:hypothetical protein
MSVSLVFCDMSIGLLIISDLCFITHTACISGHGTFRIVPKRRFVRVLYDFPAGYMHVQKALYACVLIT